MWTIANEHPIAQHLLANSDSLYLNMIDRSKRDGKSFDQLIDHAAALNVVTGLLRGEDSSTGVEAVILNDSHLLVYSVGKPWFGGDKLWLIEQFYMRVGRGSSDTALDALDEFARDLGCSTVVFGTSLAASDKALGRLLERRGYSPQSSQLIKEL